MKTAKKMLVFICVFALLFAMAGCGETKNTLEKPARTPDVQQPDAPVAEKPEESAEPEASGQEGEDSEDDMNGYVKGKELFMLLETEEEALEIAELYGIEFVSLEYGVATFHTEEDPASVVKRGLENGWPKLTINSMKNPH